MSNINIYATLECLYLCEKPPSLLRHEMGTTRNITKQVDFWKTPLRRVVPIPVS